MIKHSVHSTTVIRHHQGHHRNFFVGSLVSHVNDVGSMGVITEIIENELSQPAWKNRGRSYHVRVMWSVFDETSTDSRWSEAQHETLEREFNIVLDDSIREVTFDQEMGDCSTCTVTRDAESQAEMIEHGRCDDYSGQIRKSFHREKVVTHHKRNNW